ncbi:unnamed protein product [Amoebophrya sp. A25]|nr:unnamed protein product [Amoebophrya sp. A25]|eukprot:GSA25T00025452001.1
MGPNKEEQEDLKDSSTNEAHQAGPGIQVSPALMRAIVSAAGGGSAYCSADDGRNHLHLAEENIDAKKASEKVDEQAACASHSKAETKAKQDAEENKSEKVKQANRAKNAAASRPIHVVKSLVLPSRGGASSSVSDQQKAPGEHKSQEDRVLEKAKASKEKSVGLEPPTTCYLGLSASTERGGDVATIPPPFPASSSFHGPPVSDLVERQRNNLRPQGVSEAFPTPAGLPQADIPRRPPSGTPAGLPQADIPRPPSGSASPPKQFLLSAIGVLRNMLFRVPADAQSIGRLLPFLAPWNCQSLSNTVNTRVVVPVLDLVDRVTQDMQDMTDHAAEPPRTQTGYGGLDLPGGSRSGPGGTVLRSPGAASAAAGSNGASQMRSSVRVPTGLDHLRRGDRTTTLLRAQSQQGGGIINEDEDGVDGSSLDEEDDNEDGTDLSCLTSAAQIELTRMMKMQEMLRQNQLPSRISGGRSSSSSRKHGHAGRSGSGQQQQGRGRNQKRSGSVGGLDQQQCSPNPDDLLSPRAGVLMRPPSRGGAQGYCSQVLAKVLLQTCRVLFHMVGAAPPNRSSLPSSPRRGQVQVQGGDSRDLHKGQQQAQTVLNEEESRKLDEQVGDVMKALSACRLSEDHDCNDKEEGQQGRSSSSGCKGSSSGSSGTGSSGDPQQQQQPPVMMRRESGQRGAPFLPPVPEEPHGTMSCASSSTAGYDRGEQQITGAIPAGPSCSPMLLRRETTRNLPSVEFDRLVLPPVASKDRQCLEKQEQAPRPSPTPKSPAQGGGLDVSPLCIKNLHALDDEQVEEGRGPRERHENHEDTSDCSHSSSEDADDEDVVQGETGFHQTAFPFPDTETAEQTHAALVADILPQERDITGRTFAKRRTQRQERRRQQQGADGETATGSPASVIPQIRYEHARHGNPYFLALPVIQRILVTLNALHKRAKLCHNDVSPENLRLDAEGNPVLLDLGQAEPIPDMRAFQMLERGKGIRHGRVQYAAPEKVSVPEKLKGDVKIEDLDELSLDEEDEDEVDDIMGFYDERVDVWAFALTIHDWLLAARFGKGPTYSVLRGTELEMLEQLRSFHHRTSTSTTGEKGTGKKEGGHGPLVEVVRSCQDGSGRLSDKSTAEQDVTYGDPDKASTYALDTRIYTFRENEKLLDEDDVGEHQHQRDPPHVIHIEIPCLTEEEVPPLVLRLTEIRDAIRREEPQYLPIWLFLETLLVPKHERPRFDQALRDFQHRFGRAIEEMGNGLPAEEVQRALDGTTTDGEDDLFSEYGGACSSYGSCSLNYCSSEAGDRSSSYTTSSAPNTTTARDQEQQLVGSIASSTGDQGAGGEASSGSGGSRLGRAAITVGDVLKRILLKSVEDGSACTDQKQLLAMLTDAKADDNTTDHPGVGHDGAGPSTGASSTSCDQSFNTPVGGTRTVDVTTTTSAGGPPAPDRSASAAVHTSVEGGSHSSTTPHDKDRTTNPEHCQVDAGIEELLDTRQAEVVAESEEELTFGSLIAAIHVRALNNLSRRLRSSQ